MWRDFLGCLNQSQGTLQAVFRSEPGETASSRAIPQLCSSALNYSVLQTTTCGALAIFLCLQNVLVPWNFRFLKLTGLLICCQKLMLLGRKKCLKKKKNQAKFLCMNICLHFGKSVMLPNPGTGRVIPYQIQNYLMYLQSASSARVI